MANYLHGAYGYLDESVVQDVTTSETVPVYFGTAPVGLVRGYADADVVNAPVKISSLADAKAKIGYSEDFGSYTLCEAVAAHFDNGGTGIGPIYVVNVLDPAVHRVAEGTSKDVTFTNGRVTVPTDTAILDTLAVGRPDLGLPAQESRVRDGEEYAKALARSGVTFADGVYTYEPTGTIDPALPHENRAYIGLVFPKPEGATRVTLKADGDVMVDDADLTSDSEDVINGEVVCYFPFSDLEGNPLATPRTYVVECEWTGGDVPKTACYISRGSADYVEGTDYTLDYNTNANEVVISAIEGGGIADGAAKVTYREMDPGAVDKDDVIGMVTADGEYSGIEAVALLYQEQYVVPNLLAAPGWSHIKDVYDALVSKSQQINGHWDAFVVADLPLVDEESAMVDTIDKAVKWKEEHGYTSERSMVCWPMAVDASGRRFHVSTLAAALSLQVDQRNDGIPFESPSNKETFVVKQFFGDNAKNRGFDQQKANGLNEKGITTVIAWAGAWVLWGPHTAAYEYGNPSVDARSYFATNMRMLMHITNDFQLQWADEIDQPMTRALRDRIVNVEQAKLDGYVTVGALLGEPRCYFLEVENPVSSMMEGDFRFDLDTTPTPPMKSASAYVRYTDAGFQSYFAEDGE